MKNTLFTPYNKNNFSFKNRFLKVRLSLTIVNDNPSLMIVNDDPSLTNVSVSSKQVSRFPNDRFCPKTKRSFWKTIEKRNKKRSLNDRFQKRLTTLYTKYKI